jgi:hypothetical protein
VRYQIKMKNIIFPIIDILGYEKLVIDFEKSKKP